MLSCRFLLPNSVIIQYIIIIIYLPLSSLFTTFLSEFKSFFESISTDFILIGDFKVQVNAHSLSSETI